jgi:hypothetical protein
MKTMLNLTPCFRLSYVLRFQLKLEVINNIEYLGEFEEDFQKCWLNCVLYLLVIERGKKS